MSFRLPMQNTTRLNTQQEPSMPLDTFKHQNTYRSAPFHHSPSANIPRNGSLSPSPHITLLPGTIPSYLPNAVSRTHTLNPHTSLPPPKFSPAVHPPRPTRYAAWFAKDKKRIS
ncbi:hypothetical protein IQ07DRAFT_286138 [Pyrenochaeta sp. DS3sAY3a]|nr:hypothetical protein IQ07DRAFT_286138 [Pyrenochaeta sp. DS3sAY3a]